MVGTLIWTVSFFPLIIIASTFCFLCITLLNVLTFTFFFLFDCAGSSLLHRLSRFAGSQGRLSGCRVWASPCGGFPYCGVRAPGRGGFSRRSTRTYSAGAVPRPCTAQAPELLHPGLVAPRHEGSSGIRDRTRVSFVGTSLASSLSHQGSPLNLFNSCIVFFLVDESCFT